MPTAPPQLQRTPLFDRHLAVGGRLVEFAGWEMPVQYSGVAAEHLAVRESCGVFDVSHMGEIETSGPDALALLQRLLSNDVAAIGFDEGTGEGGAQYSLLCREDGGVLDDLITYRLGAERYLTVTNAANHGRDLEWFQEHADAFPGAQVSDAAAGYAMLAVQGPAARGIVEGLGSDQLPKRMRAGTRTLAGVSTLVCGTGYTGEDGVELMCAPQDAGALWDELLARGATPAGLGARDTLRIEACLPLYGNELTLEREPVEAGLGWACKEDTGFIGAGAVECARREPPAEQLVAFTVDGEGIARAGNPVQGGGEVTSGTYSPCLREGIGMAYVPGARAPIGSRLQIDVRGKMRAAVVRPKPLYRKG
jgi:aminomethyltransferase